MALPTLQPYYLTRKANAEKLIVNRRTHEDDFRQKWDQHSKYFHQNDVRAAKQQAWTSNQSFGSSMTAYERERSKETKKSRLSERRVKLLRMLERESAEYEMELRELKGLTPEERLARMKERADQLKFQKEEVRKQLAQVKLKEHWRANCPELRDIESRRAIRDVHEGWDEQVTQREQQVSFDRMERERYERQVELERRKALEKEREREEKKKEEGKRVGEHLQVQMKEIRQREAEAKLLKEEQDDVMRQQWEVQKAEEERKELEKKRKQQELGRVLTRQYKAQMQRKSRQIQEALELDLKILERLSEQEVEEKELQTARRERAKADAAWMKQVIEDQLKLEKSREAELDALYRDEAARQWQRREAEWEREKLARERLMKEVFDERHEQLVEKMGRLKEQQAESIERREELLRDLELANQMSARETERKEEEKGKRKRELEYQITERQRKAEEARRQFEMELEEQRQAEEEYERMLREEEEEMTHRRYEPRSHSRRNIAWD